MASLDTRITELLNIEYPIVQAPMAGGATTPELVAAASNAGGLGSLGAGYTPPGVLRETISHIRNLTDRPFAVNLFVPEAFEVNEELVDHTNTLMRPYREDLGIESPTGALSYAPSFAEQLAVVLETRVPVFSFTFGVPEDEQLSELKEAGVTVLGTATTVREARTLEEAGVDVVVGQGAEAGGHRGTFLGGYADALVGTMALIPQLVDAVSVPIVASGGIMDGRGLAAALMLGAEAVQMGTAFLTTQESGAHPEHKKAVLGAVEEDTVVTRAFSGKPARGIKNRFLSEMDEHEKKIPPYPVRNTWTKDIRSAAQEQDRPELMSLWAGQGSRMGRSQFAGELVERVAAEANTALQGGSG
ncbi:nitronate monooxygenase family protein [soil metagenome]